MNKRIQLSSIFLSLLLGLSLSVPSTADARRVSGACTSASSCAAPTDKCEGPAICGPDHNGDDPGKCIYTAATTCWDALTGAASACDPAVGCHPIAYCTTSAQCESSDQCKIWSCNANHSCAYRLKQPADCHEVPDNPATTDYCVPSLGCQHHIPDTSCLSPWADDRVMPPGNFLIVENKLKRKIGENVCQRIVSGIQNVLNGGGSIGATFSTFVNADCTKDDKIQAAYDFVLSRGLTFGLEHISDASDASPGLTKEERKASLSPFTIKF